MYWEIFTPSGSYLQKLIDTHRHDKGLDIRKVTFNADYPNPREVELKPAVE